MLSDDRFINTPNSFFVFMEGFTDAVSQRRVNTLSEMEVLLRQAQMERANYVRPTQKPNIYLIAINRNTSEIGKASVTTRDTPTPNNSPNSSSVLVDKQGSESRVVNSVFLSLRFGLLVTVTANVTTVQASSRSRFSDGLPALLPFIAAQVDIYADGYWLGGFSDTKANASDAVAAGQVEDDPALINYMVLDSIHQYALSVFDIITVELRGTYWN